MPDCPWRSRASGLPEHAVHRRPHGAGSCGTEQMRLDAYSLASRLSFFLWNSAPDDELLKRAERGDLQKPEGRAKAVDTMLASPRLETGVRALVRRHVGLR